MGNARRAPNLGDIATNNANLLDDLVIARIAPASGATRSELGRDLTPFVSHRLSPSELRNELDTSLENVMNHGLVTAERARYRLTEVGREVCLSLLGGRSTPGDWSEIRDVRLVARALGLHRESTQRLKALSRPDGLRAAVLQKAFGLKGKRALSPARLRAALAGVALERAFGNKIKGEIAAGEGLSARAGRQLAGQLARRPRDFGTDSRLISALAAESVGAIQSDLGALRLAVLRNAVSRRLMERDGNPDPVGTREALHQLRAKTLVDGRGRAKPRRSRRALDKQTSLDLQQAPSEIGIANEETLQLAETRPQPAAANRPDLIGFAQIVGAVADEFGEGWPGNRKALIVHVWQTIREAYPEWGLTEIEFKAMLTEAHRTGHIVLATADLKSKMNIREIQASAISFKNTVWHLIRI